MGEWRGGGGGQARVLDGGAGGGAAGGYDGCRGEGGGEWDQSDRDESRLDTGRRTGGEYYLNSRDGCSYWRNGERRGC